MSKQDPSKVGGAPPPHYAYGSSLPQQYSSQPPPYSAHPAQQAYGVQATQVASHYAQSPYMTQQYVAMSQGTPAMTQGYVAAPSSAYPRQQFMPMLPPQHAPHQGPPPPYTPVAQPMMIPQQQTVMVGAAFDAGARFDGISQPRIPPAPPGHAPNAAQLAQMQGNTVIASQQRSNWFTGGSGGGATLF